MQIQFAVRVNPSDIMVDEKLMVAWNAAYWMMKSEATRQRRAHFPDCNWRDVEANDDWVATVATAQTEECLKAMRRTVVTGSESP